jgi:hypothetical protein
MKRFRFLPVAAAATAAARGRSRPFITAVPAPRRCGCTWAHSGPDLANAMKINPNLKVQLNAGYFDLATPFFQGMYEMRHLPMPASLQANIEYKFYDSG